MATRPTAYTSELADEICRQLAEGASLRSICAAPEMPSESTVRGWVAKDQDGFAARYTRARTLGYERMADELLEIADDGRNDWMARNDPDNPGYVLNGEHVQRSRVRLDTRKWLLAKMLPKVYGDKLPHTDGEGTGPVVVTYRWASDDEVRG